MLKIILKKLNQLIDLMLEEREEKKREREERAQKKSEREMMQYVRQQQKKVGPPLMRSSADNPDEPVHTKANILIPYGLSENERIVLEDFYGRDD